MLFNFLFSRPKFLQIFEKTVFLFTKEKLCKLILFKVKIYILM